MKTYLGFFFFFFFGRNPNCSQCWSTSGCVFRPVFPVEDPYFERPPPQESTQQGLKSDSINQQAEAIPLTEGRRSRQIEQLGRWQ